MASTLPLPASDLAALDRPIWTSLSTLHRGHALGGQLAKRYPSDMGPLAATADESRAAFAALKTLLPETAKAALFTPELFSVPDGFEVDLAAPMEQMFATRPPTASVIDDEIRVLGDADAPDMERLAALTKPGPFGPRTHALGRFVGIRAGGVLVAMSGERLHLPGYTEISAVCVHPDHRRHGYGRILVSAVVRELIEQGIAPFLHVFSHNRSAIALYEELGFVSRRQIMVTVLRHPGQPAGFL